MAQVEHASDCGFAENQTWVEINALKVVHEPAGSRPYVAVAMRIKAGPSPLPTTVGRRGALRIIAEYTDGTNQTLYNRASPLNGIDFSRSNNWYRLRNRLTWVNGDIRAGTTVTSSDRISVSTTKQIDRIEFHWRES